MRQTLELVGKLLSKLDKLNKNENISRFDDLITPNELILGLAGTGKSYYISNKCKSNDGINFIFTCRNDFSDLPNSITIDVSTYHLKPNLNGDKYIDMILLENILEKYPYDKHFKTKFEHFLTFYKKDHTHILDFLTFTKQEKIEFLNLLKDIEGTFDLTCNLNNLEMFTNCCNNKNIILDFSNVLSENLIITIFIWLDFVLQSKSFLYNKKYYCFLDDLPMFIYEEKNFLNHLLYFFNDKKISCTISSQIYLKTFSAYLPFFGIFHFCGYENEKIEKFFFEEISKLGYITKKNTLNFKTLKQDFLRNVFIIQKKDRTYLLKEKDILC